MGHKCALPCWCHTSHIASHCKVALCWGMQSGDCSICHCSTYSQQLYVDFCNLRAGQSTC